MSLLCFNSDFETLLTLFLRLLAAVLSLLLDFHVKIFLYDFFLNLSTYLFQS
jgi:hypothetical protein